VWAAGITMFMLMTGGTHPFVNAAGMLDEKKLAEGELDFGSQGVFAMFGGANTFSEAAKRFCRKLVNPTSASRMTADAAVKDPWMTLAVVDYNVGATQRAQPSRAPPPAAVPVSQAGGYVAQSHQPSGQMGLQQFFDQVGGLFFGEDQNRSPNPQESEQVKEARAKKRLQDLSSQIADIKVHKENSQLKGRIEELERERGQLQQQLQQADVKRAAAVQAVTVRESNRQSARRPTAMQAVPGQVVSGAGGRLPPQMKVRYNSSSAKCWLNAKVISFNENDGTYNLDIRQHADLQNISPDPAVRAVEAWPAGSLVSYHSTSANRWLDAVVVSFCESSTSQSTYNLDLRECAEVDRIRPR